MTLAQELRPPTLEVSRAVDMLRAADAPTRVLGAQALGRLGTPGEAGVAALNAALADRAEEVRRAAVRSLGALGAAAEPALAALDAIMEEPDGPVRRAAAVARTQIRAAVAERELKVVFADGRLSVKSDDAPLGRVLDRVSETAKIAIMRAEGVDSGRLSTEFADLPLDEGLRRILGRYDAFYYYNGETGVRAVWVYAKGEAAGLEPVMPELNAEELTARLADADPKERSRAIGALIKREGQWARDSVLRALRDQDDWVRTEALYEAGNAGLELPAHTLTELALKDPSENVRFLALEALDGNPELKDIALQALNDPSPNIQNYAREILVRLDPANWAPARPTRPAQALPRTR